MTTRPDQGDAFAGCPHRGRARSRQGEALEPRGEDHERCARGGDEVAHREPGTAAHARHPGAERRGCDRPRGHRKGKRNATEGLAPGDVAREQRADRDPEEEADAAEDLCGGEHTEGPALGFATEGTRTTVLDVSGRRPMFRCLRCPADSSSR